MTAIVLDGQTWNTCFTNNQFQGPVGGVNGMVTIPPTNGVKFLQGAFARWCWKSNKPATTPELWTVRLIIATGIFDVNNLGVQANPQVTPGLLPRNVTDFNGQAGLNQVFLDVLLTPIDPFQWTLPQPIVIPSATPVTLLMGRPIDVNQERSAAELAQSYFALYGWDEGRAGINVKFR
jgi:hypothetical protein